MGRIVDLFGEVAAEADVGGEGIVLPAEVYERLREEWDDDDIEDALKLVHETLLQGELVDCADSLSARMVEVLGEFGSPTGFQLAQSGEAVLGLETIAQLARRVHRLEEVLESYRDDEPPDRSGFDDLRRRLMDVGIEEEMSLDDEDAPAVPRPDDDDDD
jgi:uncharacterized protein with von Willebrand factor type A (vWA) domain